MQVEAEQSPRERGRWKSDAPSNLSSGQFCLGERPVKAVASTIERGSIGQRGVSRMLTPLCHWGWQKSQNQSPDRTWSVVSGAKEIFVTQKWSKCCVYETFLSPAHLVWTLYLQTAELTRMNTNQIQRFKSDLIKLETGLNQIWGKGGGFYPSWSGDLRKYLTEPSSQICVIAESRSGRWDIKWWQASVSALSWYIFTCKVWNDVLSFETSPTCPKLFQADIPVPRLFTAVSFIGVGATTWCQ